MIAERLTDCPENRSAFHRFRRKIAKRFSKIAQRFGSIAKRFVRGPISFKTIAERFTDFRQIAGRWEFR